MPAYGKLDRGFAGLLINGEDYIDGTVVVGDTAGIAFGAPVFVANGIDDTGFNAKADSLSFVLSAAFVTGNTIAGTVNGSSYSVAFTTDDATTFAALVTALNALTNTLASGNFATRTITITNKAASASATGTVTGGSSQATVTVTTSASVLLLGVAVHTHREYIGQALSEYQSVVNVLRSGKVQVAVNAAVHSGDAAYWDATNGYWTNVSGGNLATPYRFRTSAASGGLADLDCMKAPVALDA
jgi:hypothetical protein